MLQLQVLIIAVAARRIDTTYCTVSELSGTYRILLVLVILQWSSVFHTRVRDRGLCTDNAFYIPALRPLSLLHGDMSKVRPGIGDERRMTIFTADVT